MRTIPCTVESAPRRPFPVTLAGPDHRFPGPGWSLKLVSHLGDHLLWMRLRGLSERTMLCRRRACVRLAEHLGHDPITATYDELYAWQAHLLRISINQVRNQTALVRPYFQWLQDAGHRGDNPSRLLPMPRKRRGLPRPIAEVRLSEVIRTAPPRLLPWYLLAGWSGLRAGEIAGLAVENFSSDELGQHWVRVVGKGGYVRDAPILSWTWPTILAALPSSGPAWRRERGEGPVTGKIVSEACSKHLKQIGFPDRLHALRHRAATALYEASGWDIRLVQEYLGHQNSDTTAVYTQVKPQRIAAAALGLPRVALPTDGRLLQVVDAAPPAGPGAASTRRGETG